MKKFQIPNSKYQITRACPAPARMTRSGGKHMRSGGITLFIAVVIMSILLFIAFAVINVSIKANNFASSGISSQYAFYAADAGIECALYWDSTVDPSQFATSTSGSKINCGNQDITTNSQNPIPGTTTKSFIGGGGYANPTSIFGFDMNFGSNPMPACAIVTVTKNADMSTDIYSRGYNNCVIGDPKRVERGIKIKA